MAVVKQPNDLKLALVLETGEMKGDKPVLTTKTVSNIRLDATDEEVLKAGEALAKLTTRALDSVNRIDYSGLTKTV